MKLKPVVTRSLLQAENVDTTSELAKKVVLVAQRIEIRNKLNDDQQKRNWVSDCSQFGMYINLQEHQLSLQQALQVLAARSNL